MQYEQGKTFEAENLLTLRKKMTPQQIQQEMIAISHFLKESSITKIGSIITATHGVEMIKQEQIFDMEIMIPIDKCSIEDDKYLLKPQLKIVNAIYIRHEGNPQGIQNLLIQLQKDMEFHKLTQITTAYNVNIKEPSGPKGLNNMITDIYIGVNPNIL